MLTTGEMISIIVTCSITDIRDHGDWPGDSELVSISGPLSTWTGEDGRRRAAVRFGAGTLNLHYYDWALANNW